MKTGLLVLLLATVITGFSFAEDIGDARMEGRNINIYNSSKKQIASLSPSIGGSFELLGVGHDFIVVQEGDYFNTYGADGKKICSLRNNGRMSFDKVVGSQFFIKD
jgi:hypothetical protein